MTPTLPSLAGSARDLLAAGKSVRFRAKGSSMRPFIRAGDLVEVTPVVIA